MALGEKLFEDNTGKITNGTIWIKFNYTITEPTASEIEYYTKDGELSLEVTER